MNEKPLTLSGLAYACRLYREFTDYESASDELHVVTGATLDLDDAGHKLALLRWLNAWGCRQFAKDYHSTASKELQAWGSEWLKGLPGPTENLLRLTDDAIDVSSDACDDLIQRTASRRRYGKEERNIGFGATGAAKVLHALRPNAFVPWDSPIRHALGFGETGPEYGRFLRHIKAEANEVIQDAKKHGIAQDRIPAAIGRDGAGLPKLIDEFYWVTITRGCSIPEKAEVENWARWML